MRLPLYSHGLYTLRDRSYKTSPTSSSVHVYTVYYVKRYGYVGRDCILNFMLTLFPYFWSFCFPYILKACCHRSLCTLSRKTVGCPAVSSGHNKVCVCVGVGWWGGGGGGGGGSITNKRNSCLSPAHNFSDGGLYSC